MSTISLSGVRKSFGAVEALRGIDLEIEDGEFVVFVGPSGCGKSTLLRAISGLEEISQGQIAFDGRDMTYAAPGKRGLAMVFQSYSLYPHMTVERNIGFALGVHGASKSEVATKVLTVAKMLKLEQYLDRLPSELSGGQKQRVAIGRALVRDPEILLFDEPLSNLDAELRVQMRVELAELHQRLRQTLIYVTHDQVEAMTLADRIVVMRAGQIEQVGKPRQLYSDPDNVFVAGFIGTPKMNFLRVDLKPGPAGGWCVLAPDFEGDPLILSLSDALEGSAVIGIRPEAFHPDADVKLGLTVRTVEDLGGMQYAYCRTGSGVELTVHLDKNQVVSPGQTIVVGVPPQEIFAFDHDTGRRMK